MADRPLRVKAHKPLKERHTTPVAFTPCIYCGVEVSAVAKGTWREVTGWVEQRAGGGTHGVHAEKPTGRYACSDCMSLVRRGINPAQGKLI